LTDKILLGKQECTGIFVLCFHAHNSLPCENCGDFEGDSGAFSFRFPASIRLSGLCLPM
jgi:hypothetical protein